MALTTCKLSLAATVYWLWREWNLWLFQQKGMDFSLLQLSIIEDVCACLSSWRGIRDSAQNLSIVTS
ncbi:hypothetical protein RHMOL_Rhmol07G0292500 [Rhododendron molle]|uniref:Uncharacterized protein n=1 Tax=Rhododendron molle TaxID=49168 RepID=A0ACC0N668_RHOML|nr:hypothetical protein RHMOL_Rhmol07G0292500 [Rhododendron molle]